ncbi:alanine or glycine:cation symporter, AGCS family [Raineyella antarctica]|uniref:Alanine or glycine:cation symporter, AGCS family n=1 Tax=Raineyella antarctica TaxID=1577474 RepID=A0A1G6GDL2_9ACTN|nr:sodium:alanine symporter family protein [Raineyella antarctica]SDB80081.1 alanine or glycine:cation symporter, AGCS family [Raineyella antarctica]
MDGLQGALDTIDGFIWGPYLLIPLLLGTGVYLTIRLGGLQFLKLGAALRLAFGDSREDAEGDVSHYQALTTALAATVGVGNIAGVATAISLGGPGAVFWMWVTALLGMATKYAEAFMGVRFRSQDANGGMNGGPQHYLAKAIPGRLGVTLSVMFAVFALVASFGIGNMTQVNTVVTQIEGSFQVAPWITGLLLVIATGLAVIGGIKSIGKVTAAFVPLMIVFYIAAALLVLVLNIGNLLPAFGVIFSDAFTGTAATGGFVGAGVAAAIQFGVARGIFSNESGLGTAGIAAAAAKTAHPVRQGLVSMTQTFIDTIIVVSMTGLVIVTTGAWQVPGLKASQITSAAFDMGLPGDWGHYLVTIAVIFFAYSTVLGWEYYGERNAERLWGVRAVYVYRVVFTLVVFVGATIELDTVWTFSDIANGLMALPNLIGLLVCGGLIARETRAYLNHDADLRNPPLVSTLHGTDELGEPVDVLVR